MPTTTDLTYAELIARIEQLNAANMLDLNTPVQLSIGQGRATKSLIGTKIEVDGTVTLVVEGNAPAQPKKKKAPPAAAA